MYSRVRGIYLYSAVCNAPKSWFNRPKRLLRIILLSRFYPLFFSFFFFKYTYIYIHLYTYCKQDKRADVQLTRTFARRFARSIRKTCLLKKQTGWPDSCCAHFRVFLLNSAIAFAGNPINYVARIRVKYKQVKSVSRRLLCTRNRQIIS